MIQKVKLYIANISSCHTEISLRMQLPLQISQSRLIGKSADALHSFSKIIEKQFILYFIVHKVISLNIEEKMNNFLVLLQNKL